MYFSPKGIALLKSLEGLRLIPYADDAGKETNGYGHLYEPGEAVGTITEAQAAKWLEADCNVVITCIDRLIRVTLTQNQFDALVCLIYNIGCNAFLHSTMLRLLNDGADANEVANEFDRWVYVNGQIDQALVTRRQKEKELFLGGAE